MIKDLLEIIPDHILHLELSLIKHSGINRIEQAMQLENTRIAYFIVPRYSYVEPKAADMIQLISQAPLRSFHLLFASIPGKKQM